MAKAKEELQGLLRPILATALGAGIGGGIPSLAAYLSTSPKHRKKWQRLVIPGAGFGAMGGYGASEFMPNKGALDSMIYGSLAGLGGAGMGIGAAKLLATEEDEGKMASDLNSIRNTLLKNAADFSLNLTTPWGPEAQIQKLMQLKQVLGPGQTGAPIVSNMVQSPYNMQQTAPYQMSPYQMMPQYYPEQVQSPGRTWLGAARDYGMGGAAALGAGGAAYTGAKAIQNRNSYAPFYNKRMNSVMAREARAQRAIDAVNKAEQRQIGIRKFLKDNPKLSGVRKRMFEQYLERKSPVSAERLARAKQILSPGGRYGSGLKAFGQTLMSTFKGNDPVKFLFKVLTRGRVK